MNRIPFQLLVCVLALSACTDNPTEPSATLFVGRYHQIQSTATKLEVKSDYSCESYFLNPDSTKKSVSMGRVLFDGDTIQLVANPCNACDTVKLLSHDDTLLLVSLGGSTPIHKPPAPWMVKE